MENKLEIIKVETIFDKTVQVYGTFDEPLFLAKDVAEWIDYSKSGNGSYNITQMLSAIDESEKIYSSTNIVSRNVWMLTEDGLYEVLMQSRKPIARQFKTEIKKMLKSVRKNGGYIANQDKLTPEQILANAIMVAKNVIDEQKKQIEHKDQLLLEQEPMVTFCNKVSASSDLILIRELAKIISDSGFVIGERRLFSWMRENEYLSRRNEPYQSVINAGYMEMKERVIHTPYGQKISITPYVTGKGQIYFTEKILKEHEKQKEIAKSMQ